MGSPCGRFAPSPTGPLHFGYLEARKSNGKWLVRIEDVDETRTVKGAGDGILRELERLGLWWDEQVVWQSTRKELYNAALDDLRKRGQTFPCACSRRDIAQATTGRDDERTGGGIVYPGTCRHGLPAGKTARAVRMRAAGTVRVLDEVQGEYVQQVESAVGDFVLLRGDGLHAYHLAVVADDHEQRVTQVVRGSDLLSSTPPQLLLYAALRAPPPSYSHVPVAVDHNGQKLSKRTQAQPTSLLPAPFLVSHVLSFLGHPPPEELRSASPVAQWRWAVQHWDMARVPAAMGREWDLSKALP